ncbi:MAG: hypothetical protein QW806_10250 [Nitrososphaerota archaeon]
MLVNNNLSEIDIQRIRKMREIVSTLPDFPFTRKEVKRWFNELRPPLYYLVSEDDDDFASNILRFSRQKFIQNLFNYYTLRSILNVRHNKKTYIGIVDKKLYNLFTLLLDQVAKPLTSVSIRNRINFGIISTVSDEMRKSKYYNFISTNLLSKNSYIYYTLAKNYISSTDDEKKKYEEFLQSYYRYRGGKSRQSFFVTKLFFTLPHEYLVSLMILYLVTTKCSKRKKPMKCSIKLPSRTLSRKIYENFSTIDSYSLLQYQFDHFRKHIQEFYIFSKENLFKCL